MWLKRCLMIWGHVLLCSVWLCTANAVAANPDDLLDGLHRDAANAEFESYFARFTPDGVFLGTDQAERWSIDAFKAYAKPIFDTGKGWRYEVVSRHWAGTEDTRWFDEVLWNEKYGYCRGTGVIQSTEAGWRIAHYSLTFLIPNELAGEMAKMTRALQEQPCCVKE